MSNKTHSVRVSDAFLKFMVRVHQYVLSSRSVSFAFAGSYCYCGFEKGGD